MPVDHAACQKLAWIQTSLDVAAGFKRAPLEHYVFISTSYPGSLPHEFLFSIFIIVI